ncbi:MAG TPA: HupE/UreJ family protein [Verrucomicrobiae bacterium]|jgi:hydrogenase/urease accessory protein HupE
MKRARRVLLLLGMLVLAACGPRAFAHDPGLSTGLLRVSEQGVEAILTFALADIESLVVLDNDLDGKVSPGEFAYGKTRLAELAAAALVVKFDHQTARPSEPDLQLDEAKNVQMQMTFPGKLVSRLTVEVRILARFSPGHRQLFSIFDASGAKLAQRLVSARANSITIELDGPEAAPGAAPVPNTFFGFLKMGVEHIWTGYDHLLFLFALLLVTGNFLSSAKIITCFTLAHSITLALATLNVVQVPSRFVEPLIAASIVYVGVENLLRRDGPKGRWRLTFAFGLVHGFGFASVLKGMGVSSAQGGVAMPLLSFNLGVELGQIAIAVILLPIIWRLRTKPVFVNRWAPACSALVAMAGGYWFVERVWLG